MCFNSKDYGFGKLVLVVFLCFVYFLLFLFFGFNVTIRITISYVKGFSIIN